MQRKLSNDPETLAKLFAYYIYQKRAGDYHVNFANISVKTFFGKYRRHFNMLSKLFQKYGINNQDYLHYCVYDQGINFFNVSKILDIKNIREYANYSKIKEQYKKIYSYFLKSANYIANECIDHGYGTCKEFLKRQVIHNTLAEKMISGKISIYYLASIKNIEEIISKMNQINKDTFQTLVERKDKLNSDVQNAFLFVTMKKVNPIKFTDDLLSKKLICVRFYLKCLPKTIQRLLYRTRSRISMFR